MLALAIIPGIVLFCIVWKYDSVEKEPPGLLLKLFACGALTVVISLCIRSGWLKIAPGMFESKMSLGFLLVDNFIIVALVQEGLKLLALRLVTWKNREFNYTFDAVVYAVTVALGYAVLLNIIYGFRYGMSGVFIRAVFSVPGHVMNAVFMGYYFGLARYAKGAGNESDVRLHIAEALIIPVILHGFYDYCISVGKTSFFILFFVYEIVITVITVKQFLKLAKTDTLIPGMEYTISSVGNKAEGGSDESKM